LNEVVFEGMLVIAAGRMYVSSRPPALARPRRGSADLPDRDAPERSSSPERSVAPSTQGTDRWVVPASVGLVAVVGGIVARAAMLI
jgi:hypothetical protein